MEEELERYRLIVESLPDGVFLFDFKGNVTSVNSVVLNYGYKKEEVIGKSLLEFIPEKYWPMMSRQLADIAKGKSTQGELEINTEQGTVMVEFRSSPIKKRGKIIGFQSIVRDITERKKAGEALWKSEEQARLLVEFRNKFIDTAVVWINLLDKEGNVTLWNRAAELISGYSREEVTGHKEIWEWLYPDPKYRAKSFAQIKQLIKKGERAENYYTTIRCKDGTLKTISWYSNNILDKKGKPVGLIAIGIDITERKRFEERLSALNRYSQSLNGAESMEEIYTLTLKAMEKTLGFEYAAFLMREGKVLRLVNYCGYPEMLAFKLPLDGQKGITVKAAKTGKPVFVPDVRKDKAYVGAGVKGMLSELAVPVKVGDKVLGVLNVESERLAAFDDDDKELVEILASHAATAISNLKYAKNLEDYAQEIRESEEKFERLFMDNPEAAVYLGPDFHILDVNPRFEELFGYSLEEIKGKHIDDVIVPKDKMKEAKMLAKKFMKENVYYNTVRKRKDGSFVPVSISAAPITIDGQLVGYLGLYKDVTARKKVEEALRRAEERARALNIYSRNLNMAESMEEIYRLTLDAMEKTLGFEIAFFMVVDKNMLCTVDQRGYPRALSITLPLDGTKGGVSVKTARTGKSILVPDAEKEDAWVEFWPGIRSGLDVPVKIGRKVLGVIGVESKTLNAFGENDQKLLEILASHAATAISNLKYAKNLEKLVQERTRELEKTHEQLLKAERLAAIGELSTMVGHDLRNPLSSIQNASYYLKMKLGASKDERVRKMFEVIDRGVNYANNIIKDLLDFSRVMKPELKKVDLISSIQDALEQLKFPENVKITTKFGEVPAIEADPDQLQRVFQNIALNGIQAMPNSGELTASARKNGDFVEIAFTDTGVGIPEENMDKLFTPLFTTKAQGVGLGLAICKNLVEGHNGRMEVKSKVGEGSAFTVRLPIHQNKGGERQA